MINILIGFCIGGGLGILTLNSYQNCLIMVAKEGHNEKIKGKWYEIREVK